MRRKEILSGPSIKWRVEKLNPDAIGISASRRTDIPGLFGRWFLQRLEEGFCEYIPAGPPRCLRCSLRPEDVTHFTFWTRWPRPFFPVLQKVVEIGYPVLWNVTITGLGGTPVEPKVPATHKVLVSVNDLASLVSLPAIQWRYDPIFWSKTYDAEHHIKTFKFLAEHLAGKVDRVATSFPELYERRVAPDLRAYERETGDRLLQPDLAEKVDLVSRLKEIARGFGLQLTVCCNPDVRVASGCSQSACNSFDWACRVYPQLTDHRKLKLKPTRPDCACTAEVDIGVYDTCIYACRYSYGSRNREAATRNFRRHDPEATCILA